VPLLLYLHVRRGTGTPEAAEKKTVEQVR
jgi:hypothetical protein